MLKYTLTNLLVFFPPIKPLSVEESCSECEQLPRSLADSVSESFTFITSFEVVSAYIKRISDVRQTLNCVVEDRFKDALQEASEVDKMISDNPSPEHWEQTKPLLGVPVTVKESISVKGLSWNSGQKLADPVKGEEDANAVMKLREAGAIILLVSTTPELCCSYETFNLAQGLTRNPYDPRRTCGGSSGGEGSLIGSGASVIGLGSDMAGSSRIPALFCGIYGHKPTPGAVSVDGHKPTSADKKAFSKFFTIAPLCRYAEDLPLFLDAIAVDDDVREKLNLHTPVDLSKIKIYYMESDECFISDRVHKEIQGGIKNSLKHLETKFGIKPQLVNLNLQRLWVGAIVIMTRLTGLLTAYSKSPENPDEWNSVIKELLKFFTFTSNHTFPALLLGPMKKMADYKAKQNISLYTDIKNSLMTALRDILKDDGVLICPMFYDLANYHYQFYYKVLNTNYCTLANFTELPSTAVPLGLAKDGRPLGIQLITNQFQDRLSFAVAKELELAFGGWAAPPAKPVNAEEIC